MFPRTLPQPEVISTDTLPTLRWGIIGPGWIADRFAAAFRHHTRQQLVAVAGRNQEKTAAFAGRWDIPQVFTDASEMLALKDLDVVYVATPHNHHFPDAMKVLQAGKHVLIEKPLALNAQEGAKLQQEARARKLFCLEGMWCDFTPKYDVLRQLLANGDLGDLHTLIADHGEYFTPDHRIFNPDLAGGPMLDLGSYLISLSITVAGSVPAHVLAQGQPAPGGVNGQASMLFTHDNGMHSVLNTTLFSRTPSGAVIAGRDATLSLNGHFYAPGDFTLASSEGNQLLHWKDKGGHYEQLSYEIEHTAWCIGQGLIESPIRPLGTSLMTLSTMDNVRRQLGIVFNEERQD